MERRPFRKIITSLLVKRIGIVERKDCFLRKQASFRFIRHPFLWGLKLFRERWKLLQLRSSCAQTDWSGFCELWWRCNMWKSTSLGSSCPRREASCSKKDPGQRAYVASRNLKDKEVADVSVFSQAWLCLSRTKHIRNFHPKVTPHWSQDIPWPWGMQLLSMVVSLMTCGPNCPDAFVKMIAAQRFSKKWPLHQIDVKDIIVCYRAMPAMTTWKCPSCHYSKTLQLLCWMLDLAAAHWESSLLKSTHRLEVKLPVECLECLF